MAHAIGSYFFFYISFIFFVSSYIIEYTNPSNGGDDTILAFSDLPEKNMSYSLPFSSYTSKFK